MTVPHVTSSTGHLLSEPFTVTVRHLIYLKVFNVFKHAYRSSRYQQVHLSIRTGYHIEHIYWRCESFNTLSHFQSRLTLHLQYLHRHWTSTFPPMYLPRTIHLRILLAITSNHICSLYILFLSTKVKLCSARTDTTQTYTCTYYLHTTYPQWLLILIPKGNQCILPWLIIIK